MASMKREILLFLSLLLIGSAFGQTITTAQPDSACVGTTEMYRVANHAGSTYQWTVTSNSGVNTIVGTGNEIHINWSSNPGNEMITVRETSDKGCLGDIVQLPVVLVPHPTVVAPADFAVCASQPTIDLIASATSYKRVLWTGGSGSFSITNGLSTSYTVTPADIAAGSVTLTITAYPLGPCTPPVTDVVVITFDPIPIVSAGSDQTICSTSTVTLNATVEHASTMLWTTSGDGTFSPNNAGASVYTPGTTDIASGSVTLTMTAQPSGTCPLPVSDALVVTITPAPVANAGPGMTLCASSSITITGASAANYSSLSWGSSGTGTWTNQTTLTPTYTPSAADTVAGSVTLTLTANATSPCLAAATSQMIITFSPDPIAMAGVDQTICSNGLATLAGKAFHSQSVLWTTAGDGSFDDASKLNAIYTPGPNDINVGFADLTLTANGIAPCGTTHSDQIHIVIIKAVVANAGPDIKTCPEIQPVSLAAATVTNGASMLWTTSGSGTFTNPTSLGAFYTPSQEDINNGSVTLTLTVDGNSPCSVVIDSLLLEFYAKPVTSPIEHY